MNHDEVRSFLSRAITRLEQKRNAIDSQLEKLRAAQSAIDDIPSEALEFAASEDDEEEISPATAQQTHYDRIAAFLWEESEPQTIAEIESATMIPKASVSAVLYRTHPNEFISCEMVGNSRAKGWVLKNGPLGRKLHPPEEDIPF